MSRESWFYYRDRQQGTIRIKARRKPSVYTIPKSGTWVLQEFDPDKYNYFMPHFPEITWGALKEMNFIRKEEIL